LLIYSAAGLATTLLVAWSCAMWSRIWGHTENDIYVTSSTLPSMRIDNYHAFGSEYVLSFTIPWQVDINLTVAKGAKVCNLSDYWWGSIIDSTTERDLIEKRRLKCFVAGHGWPLRSLWSKGKALRSREFGASYQKVTECSGGIVWPLGTDREISIVDERVLPLFPLWFGLFADTIFFAIVWWALPKLILIAIRTIRKRYYLIAVFVCLALGLLTTVCGAWSNALLNKSPYPYETSNYILLEDTDEHRFVTRYENTSSILLKFDRHNHHSGSQENLNYSAKQVLPHWVKSNIPKEPSSYRHAWVVGSGWPAISMRASYDTDELGGGRFIRSARIIGITEGISSTSKQFRGLLDGYDEVVLPLVPIWPGFLLNILFYSVIWFLIWNGFISLYVLQRRLLRQHKGRCPQCAYDLRRGSSIGCPECGWGREEEA